MPLSVLGMVGKTFKMESIRVCCQRVSSLLKFVVPERKIMGRGRSSGWRILSFSTRSERGVIRTDIFPNAIV